MESKQEDTVRRRSAKPEWLKDVAAYGKPDRRRALWQITNTFVPYILLWVVMVRTVQLGYSYWLTLALAVVASGFLVRIFILFHDCTHGSFFASQRANRVLGYIAGIVTFTPFDEWRYSHAVHHGTSGDLDRRGVGDIWTMTVGEYQSAGKGQRRQQTGGMELGWATTSFIPSLFSSNEQADEFLHAPFSQPLSHGVVTSL